MQNSKLGKSAWNSLLVAAHGNERAFTAKRMSESIATIHRAIDSDHSLTLRRPMAYATEELLCRRLNGAPGTRHCRDGNLVWPFSGRGH